MSHDNRRIVRELTIPEGAAKSLATAPLDLGRLVVCGIECPADVNSETALTLLFSPGKAGENADRTPGDVTIPTQDSDYSALEDDEGTTPTVAIGNSKRLTFTGTLSTLCMNSDRFLQIGVSGNAPAGGLTFGIRLREI